MALYIKRVYDAPSEEDGRRILVDRLWPRGLKRESAHIHQWAKEIAPGSELRRWFNHDPARWTEFRKRYLLELASPEQEQALDDIAALADRETVTLLFAAKDVSHNNAVVLQQVIERRTKS